jgi:uncharacterized protein (UPF0333 family)
MANTKRVQLRKGTEVEHSSFTGALAEVTVDTTKKVLRVHDGTTVGGFEVSKARYTGISSTSNLNANIKYFVDTSSQSFQVTLPSLVNVGDYITLIDSESYWSINNLIVNPQSGQQFKDFQGLIDSPLVCDVAGAFVDLVWEGSYWRVFV